MKPSDASASPHILVTGGAGFIGANLVRLLSDEGYQVRVLDNFSTGRREYLEGLDLEIIEGDILDTKTVAEAVAGVDGVVHLAAQMTATGSRRASSSTWTICAGRFCWRWRALYCVQHSAR